MEKLKKTLDMSDIHLQLLLMCYFRFLKGRKSNTTDVL